MVWPKSPIMPKYSICITHYNNRLTVEESLQSILGQINDDFEIVIVDSRSKDGSTEILMKYAKEGRIKLIERRCSRGAGRQMALKKSTGKYVISGLDMDDTFRPELASFLRFYHDRVEGKLLSGLGEATMIGPRELLSGLGGWRDLQFRENWELCRRAAKFDGYRWTLFPLVKRLNPHEERRSFIRTTRYRYIRYRENLRVGHKQFDPGEKRGVNQEIVWLFARLAVLFLPKYRADYAFTSVDPKDFVDSSEFWTNNNDIERKRSLYRTLLKREI